MLIHFGGMGGGKGGGVGECAYLSLSGSRRGVGWEWTLTNFFCLLGWALIRGGR